MSLDLLRIASLLLRTGFRVSCVTRWACRLHADVCEGKRVCWVWNVTYCFYDM